MDGELTVRSEGGAECQKVQEEMTPESISNTPGSGSMSGEGSARLKTEGDIGWGNGMMI